VSREPSLARARGHLLYAACLTASVKRNRLVSGSNW
jgi:hypothetical protein